MADITGPLSPAFSGGPDVVGVQEGFSGPPGTGKAVVFVRFPHGSVRFQCLIQFYINAQGGDGRNRPDDQKPDVLRVFVFQSSLMKFVRS